MKTIFHRIFIFIFLVMLGMLSQAQHMFYHLLPGFTAAFTWVGLGGDANWNTSANWSTGVVPGAGNTAIFDENCLSNCNPTLNVAINVGGINIKNTYAGTITQGVGNAITIGVSGWTQMAGTFAGSNAAINLNGPFSLSGGTVTATSGTWTQAADFSKTGGIFNHNLGTFSFSASATIIPGSVSFNHVSFVGIGVHHNLSSGIMIVEGNLILTDGNMPFGTINSGTINAHGNVTTLSQGKGGSALIKFTGAGAQILTGTSGVIPNIEIDKPSGTLSMAGTIAVDGNWTWTAGAVDATTSSSTLTFTKTATIVPGNIDYYNVTFGGIPGHQNLSGGTMKIKNDLVLSDGNTPIGAINNGTLNVEGNITTQNTGKEGTALIRIIGTGAQTLNGIAGSAPAIEINKPSGTLTMSGTINEQVSWTWIAGTVDASTSTLSFGSSATITPGPVNYNNVTFAGIGATQNLNAGSMSVTGTLTLADGNTPVGSVNNGTLNASGNVVFSNQGKTGTALLNFTGTASTTLTVAAGVSTLATTHNVAKTGVGKVSLVANFSYSDVGRNFSITSGTFDVAGFTFSVNSLLTISAGGRLLCSGGTATAGSWSLSGEISCGTGQGITWTGAGGDNLWSTATNWTNSTVPGASDNAIFNASVCVGAACNAQINSNLSVRGINLQSTYTGTLTQNTTRTLTVGAGGFIQDGGTYAGGDSAKTVTGFFIQSGGTYTATSATWTQSGSMTLSGGTFNHNGGTWYTASTITVSMGGRTFNNVTFSGSGHVQNLNAQTMIVIGTLTLSDGVVSTSLLNNGTIEARGNIVNVNQGKNGTVILQINGTGPQTITGVSSGAYPEIVVNKALGTLTMVGQIRLTRNWSIISGTVDAGTSLLSFYGSSVTQTIIPGSVNYYDVTFAGDFVSHNLSAGTMVVTHLLTLADANGSIGTISNGTIEARGDITLTTAGKRVTGLILINGTGGQTLTGSASAYIGNVTINKASGTLTLAGTVRVLGSWLYQAGLFDAGTSSLQFDVIGGTTTENLGALTYNNLTFAGNNASYDLAGSNVIVNGILSFADANGTIGTISNGTIEARGDITIASQGKNITGQFIINGTGAQTFTGIASGRIGNITINKPSGTLTLASTIRILGTFTYTAGTMSAGTSTVQFEASQNIFPNGIELNNVTFTGNFATQNLNAQTLVVNGLLTLLEATGSAGPINNGTIDLKGSATGISTAGRSGTAVLNFIGNTNGTLTWTAGQFLSTNHNMAKTGGASVVAGSNLNYTTAGRDLTIASGFLDLNGFDLTVNDILTISAGATLKCNGGEFTTLTLTNLGTVNCPGYSTYDFNWTGAGGNANWTTAGNWQGGVVPGTTDIVVFQDTYCGATCDSTISINQNAKGVRLYSPFTGTITQGAGAQLFVGSRGYTQAAGTFQGGSSAISVGSKFVLTGGIFNLNSAWLGTDGLTWNTSAGTFNPGTGTVSFSGSGGTVALNQGTNTFYNLNLYGWGTSYTTTGTVIVNNDFNFGTGSGSSTNLTGGVFELKGNVTMVSFGLATSTASTIFRINGTGSQTLTGSGGTMTSLEINKPSGTLTLAGTMTQNGAFNYVAGSVSPGTSTVRFMQYNGTTTHSPNGITLANVTFDHIASNANINLNNQTLNTTGTVTFTSSLGNAYLNSGTLTIAGNAVKTGTTAIGGSANVQFVGSSNTTITPSGTNAFPGNTTINKSGGASVTLTGNAYFNNAGQNLTVSAGTLDMAGFNLTVGNNISNAGIIQRGLNPSCGTITQGGSYSGTAAICP